MGLNFRKSISLGKGLKLNLGKKSAGLSYGIKGARVSVNSSGTARATVGIPGTGISYSKTFGKKEQKAVKNKFEEFKDKIFGDKDDDEKEAKRGKKSSEEVVLNKAVEEYNEDVEEVIGIHRDGVEPIDWNNKKDIPREVEKYTEGVLKGNIDDYYSVIEEIAPFDALVEFGSEFEIGTDNPELMMVEFNIKADEVIPKTEIKQLASGKVTEKELTKTAYYDIYQDYVCSVTIRLARDIFALLPVQTVVVHAVDYEINSATGNDEEVTYLSVAFDRKTFETINLDRIDPSDSLVNFKYNMKFAKTTGFKPIEKITEW